LDGTQEVPEDYTEISLVCVRQDRMHLGREVRKNSARLLDKAAGNDQNENNTFSLIASSQGKK